LASWKGKNGRNIRHPVQILTWFLDNIILITNLIITTI
jgi:hypothetical protein